MFKELIAGRSALELTREHWDTLTTSGVYIYLNGDIALYVGSTRNALKRVLAYNHQAYDLRKRATSILFIPCKSRTAAFALEKTLIANLQPEGNIRCKNSNVPLAAALGVSETRARELTEELRESIESRAESDVSSISVPAEQTESS